MTPAVRSPVLAARWSTAGDSYDFVFERERVVLRPLLELEEDFLPLLLVLFLRPEPLFFPPPDCLFTVAQARRSDSSFETPRFSYPSSMLLVLRFCLLV